LNKKIKGVEATAPIFAKAPFTELLLVMQRVTPIFQLFYSATKLSTKRPIPPIKKR
jgi:hypothetical protein